jgi:uncharacterized membrane protein YcjF (UPF0283 family)
VDAPGNDGNASMPEQVKRPHPWWKIMMMMMMMMFTFSVKYPVALGVEYVLLLLGMGSPTEEVRRWLKLGSFYRLKEAFRDLHVVGRILIPVYYVDM